MILVSFAIFSYFCQKEKIFIVIKNTKVFTLWKENKGFCRSYMRQEEPRDANAGFRSTCEQFSSNVFPPSAIYYLRRTLADLTIFQQSFDIRVR